MAIQTPCKAERTLAEAMILFKQQQFCGAANRAYYSLYQATVALLARSFTPQRLCQGKEFDPKWPDHWPHSCVIRESEKKVYAGAGQLLSTAWGLRRKADYTPVPVRDIELDAVLKRVPAVLTEVGKKGVTYQNGAAGDKPSIPAGTEG